MTFLKCRNIFHFRILKVDPYNAACLPLHIAVLKMLNKPNGQFVHCPTASLFHSLKCSLRRISELFYLGHRLVDLYPKKPVIKIVIVSRFFLIITISSPVENVVFICYFAFVWSPVTVPLLYPIIPVWPFFNKGLCFPHHCFCLFVLFVLRWTRF